MKVYISARLKPLTEHGDIYRIVCGVPAGCPGCLGFAVSRKFLSGRTLGRSLIETEHYIWELASQGVFPAVGAATIVAERTEASGEPLAGLGRHCTPSQWGS